MTANPSRATMRATRAQGAAVPEALRRDSRLLLPNPVPSLDEGIAAKLSALQPHIDEPARAA